LLAGVFCLSYWIFLGLLGSGSSIAELLRCLLYFIYFFPSSHFNYLRTKSSLFLHSLYYHAIYYWSLVWKNGQQLLNL